MSIHGICFDDGMSGNCGLECRGFLDMKCDIVDEIIEQCGETMTEEDWENVEEVYGQCEKRYCINSKQGVF